MLINKLLPVMIFFFTGYALKKTGVFSKDDGSIFLRAVVYLCLPLISFNTFSHLELGIERLFPIITAVFVITGNFFIAKLYFRKISPQASVNTVFLISGLVLNTSLMLPFVQARWGEEGTAIVLLFDVSHVTMVFTFTYWVAMRYGNDRGGRVPVSKLLKLPPLWGIALGLLVNLVSVPVPGVITNLAEIATRSLVLLMMTALGLFFEFRLKHPGIVAGALVQRCIGGFLIAYLVTWILGVAGAERQMMLLIASAPVGFNTLVITDLEDLNREIAAEIVTSATLLAVIILPVILMSI